MLDNRGSPIASLRTLKHVVHQFLQTATSRHNDVHVIGPALWEISQCETPSRIVRLNWLRLGRPATGSGTFRVCRRRMLADVYPLALSRSVSAFLPTEHAVETC